MEQNVLSELQEIKQLTLLGAKKVLTMRDASLLTGLSMSNLYKQCCKKSIPYWKSDGGKLLFFDKNEVENWCLKHRVKTTNELETEAATYCVTGKKKGVPA